MPIRGINEGDFRAQANKSTTGVLSWLQDHSTSVTLNWGEDTDQWELSVITDGKRYTAYSPDVTGVLLSLLVKVRRELFPDAPKWYGAEK